MQRTLEKVIDYTAVVAEPEQIVLFGSMADGKFNARSDIDLLIISENSAIKEEVVAKIESYSNDLSLKVDALFFSRSEIEREGQKPNSFITAIVKSGEIVYEKMK